MGDQRRDASSGRQSPAFERYGKSLWYPLHSPAIRSVPMSDDAELTLVLRERERLTEQLMAVNGPYARLVKAGEDLLVA